MEVRTFFFAQRSLFCDLRKKICEVRLSEGVYQYLMMHLQL